jgi:putative N-acetylmannosamine-6-phosphate epimerase/predicted NBD/HSP70 family sugar kinase
VTVHELLRLLRECPIVASVQASEGSPLNDPQTLLKLAQASIQEGVRVLRLQGVENIRVIKAATGLPVMGLIKRHYADSHSYITPTMKEVDELLETDCEIIGIDAVIRRRPGDGKLSDLVERVHAAGRLVLADVDDAVAAKRAVETGADLVSSTLHGYTESTKHSGAGPGLEALREIREAVDVPVFAEGRYSQGWQVQAALRIGAVGVVLGSALNDALMQTRRFAKAAAAPAGRVGAVDIGGTWLRFAVFSPDWQMESCQKVSILTGQRERLDWIRQEVLNSGVDRVGIGTGGVVHPLSGEITHSKEIIRDNEGAVFSPKTIGAPLIALNDGLAAAWGHACHPRYAGTRVASLALGTGVGFGLVDSGQLLMGSWGWPPQLNDMPFEGSTIEEALGGAALSSGTTTQERARRAFHAALHIIEKLLCPEEIVISGGVGVSEWLHEQNGESLPRYELSPFGEDAGLFGAAALALYPPGS